MTGSGERERSGLARLWRAVAPHPGNLLFHRALVLALCLLAWYALTSPTLLPPFYFDDRHKAAFFFGEPQKVLAQA